MALDALGWSQGKKLIDEGEVDIRLMGLFIEERVRVHFKVGLHGNSIDEGFMKLQVK